MSVKLPLLVLASQSPRRKQLLESLGLTFKCVVPPHDREKTDAGANLEATVDENAFGKAEQVAELVEATAIVISADTEVVFEGNILGKPRSKEHAAEMLARLSGKTHKVLTSLCLHYQGKFHASRDWSEVTFRPLSEKDIAEYTSTREPYDKAGSYAVQGMGALFIEKIEGSYTNVMGLPIELLLRELARVSGRPVHEWFLPS